MIKIPQCYYYPGHHIFDIDTKGKGMAETWRPKPADKSVRPRRLKPYRLRRVLGIPGLFGIGYGHVGSSIYYALGVIAVVALGATPITLGIAGIIYVLNAVTYSEGSSMITEGGGSSAYARLAFNDLVGFISAWALLLSYIATVAIAAYTIPPYLSYFWPAISQPITGTLMSMGVIVVLIIINVIGIGEISGVNIVIVTIDIVVLIALIIIGLIVLMIPNPGILVEHMFGAGNWPSFENLIFGVAIAALCFTGVESIAQHSEETRQPEKKVPQTYIIMVITMLILFAGITLVALTAMTPQELGTQPGGEIGRWARSPVAGIANSISESIKEVDILNGIDPGGTGAISTPVLTTIGNLLPGFIAALATAILLMATNTGILGISRLTYNLSKNRQLPAIMNRIHYRFRTPYLSVVLFGSLAIIFLIPGFTSSRLFIDMAALYVFGSLLVFALAHGSIIRLRQTKPELLRPIRIWGNVKIGGHKFPITAILGLVLTCIIWLIVMIGRPYALWGGLTWLVVGFLIYFVYRKSQRLSLSVIGNTKAKRPRDK